MNYLVTGATGFIGRHLVPELLAKGHAVTVVEHRSPVVPELRGRVQILPSSGLEAMRGLDEVVVLHLATLFAGQHTSGQVDAMVEANLAFGQRLLEALDPKKCAGFVNVGTTWQHFESADYHPFNLYAAHKQAFEDVLRYYAEVRGLRALTLKLADSYGPEDPRRKIVSVLLAQLGKDAALDMSPGEQFVDLLHVRDAVGALLHAADLVRTRNDLPRPCSFQATSGQPLTLRALVALLSEVSGRPLRVNWGALPYRPRENLHPVTFGQRLPGWTPAVDLRSGLAELLGRAGQRSEA
ncbi:MAG: NAD(P)-dependent oxidoreductase [Myxococcales bacterium]